ncbi:uncharacterized protein LOC119192075, partial [Manduca sexta]|uniref:uncharacterized protein LOC119192075 n=1 Tax=Manduca sexta TaxID=7130 RepID=UPI00188EBAC1
RCGAGSPCEQLCRELHDGTYECGCGPGYVLHVDGYGCLELNSTKATVTSLDAEEDILYQKDVSFSAELEVAPSNRISKPILSLKHIEEEKRLTTSPSVDARHNYTYTGERSKQVDGLKSLIEDGISKTDINIIADEIKDGLLEASQKVTTIGPSLEQKVPGATVSPPWTAAVEACGCDSSCGPERCSCHHPLSKCKSDPNISTPRFSGSSWIALHALRGAYKRVRVRVRVRPETRARRAAAHRRARRPLRRLPRAHAQEWTCRTQVRLRQRRGRAAFPGARPTRPLEHNLCVPPPLGRLAATQQRKTRARQVQGSVFPDDVPRAGVGGRRRQHYRPRQQTRPLRRAAGVRRLPAHQR